MLRYTPVVAVSLVSLVGCGGETKGTNDNNCNNNTPPMCGDSLCQETETAAACPEDCAAVGVGAGSYHSCVLLVDGTARCWGNNHHGELGNGTIEDSIYPTTVVDLPQARFLATGGGTSDTPTCALLLDSSVVCWGINRAGQLGDGLLTHEQCFTWDCSTIPVPVAGVTDAIAVAVGGWHACTLLSDGTVRCWGSNEEWQLGAGPVESCGDWHCSPEPLEVNDLSDAVAISAGAEHTCAVTSDGAARCWGKNFSGQLGNGTTIDSAVPAAVTGMTEAVAVSAGRSHSCALSSNGAAMCWGANNFGQLGSGSTDDSSVPGAVDGLADLVSIEAGEFHTCAADSDGTVWCWGSDLYGEIGDGPQVQEICMTRGCSLVPTLVTALSGVISISARYAHTCAVVSDGTAWCWGWNAYGQLGDGTTTDASVPVQVVGF